MFRKNKDNVTVWVPKKDIDDEKRANEMLTGWHYYDSKGKETEASIQNSNTIK